MPWPPLGYLGTQRGWRLAIHTPQGSQKLQKTPSQSAASFKNHRQLKRTDSDEDLGNSYTLKLNDSTFWLIQEQSKSYGFHQRKETRLRESPASW